MTITTKDMLTEVRREIWYRKRAYPRWKANREIEDPEADAKLDRQLAIMEAVEEMLRQKVEAEKPQLRMDL